MIDLVHGVVSGWSLALQTHYNYVDRDVFADYLRHRPTRYVAWADRADGDVLTVDDATQAGADACLIARTLGHDVTLFVNPYNIVEAVPYPISIIDALIDQRQRETATFGGGVWELSTPALVLRFRKAVKRDMMADPDPNARALLSALRQALGVAAFALPPHMAVPSLAELRRLRAAGVQIENHGWHHIDISTLDLLRLQEHITRAADWLAATVDGRDGLYAVPYGLAALPAGALACVQGAYFLADKSRPLGECAARCWNRREITSELR